MSSELQIQSPILGLIVARAVEKKLQTAIFDSTAIDHIHVAAAPIATAPTNAVIRLQVPLEVSFKSGGNVLAKIDGPTATHRQGMVTAILELAATGATVTLRCLDVDIGSVEEFLGASSIETKKALILSIGSPFTSDLSDVFKKLGVPIPVFPAWILLAAWSRCVLSPRAQPRHVFRPDRNGVSFSTAQQSKNWQNQNYQPTSPATSLHWSSTPDGVPPIAFRMSISTTHAKLPKSASPWWVTSVGPSAAIFR